MKWDIKPIVFFLVTFHAAIAQKNEIGFRKIDSLNGKPIGKINAIAQSPDGFMWFAGSDDSNQGLYRYDGHHLIRFKYEVGNPNSLGEGRVETIYADRKGLIWIGFADKMASLGELTAGIAHEIQNPLNFVNNFSEVNLELATEMRTELLQMDLKSTYKNQLEGFIDNLTQNEEKINHHGRRADAIVKGMLQHSRISSGKKEPADINQLADEYLRLAYHGLRAKDKSFNATLKTAYDESIGKINIVPQDIGRVLLNFYNNAFYAVSEKKQVTGQGYEPTVEVSTKKEAGNIEIRVKDNGNGIQRKVLDKIFQPFFTTKPAGQGTGLGLSISFDIVKAHGGEIKVDTTEGEYTRFMISLPG